MKAAVAFLLALFWLCDFRALAGEDSQRFERPGDYELYDGQLLIFITSENGLVRYSIGKDRFRAGLAADEAFPENSPWFVWPASTTEVWAYHGSGPLRLITVGIADVRFDQSNSNPDLLKRAPKEVLSLFEERVGK